ncbi:hypothetical protein [Enterobacter cloacae complex sp. GF14B]|uniref:hypothetical protein n=1 Tax=Enterobacter cloacae complex sp. GF14B TaxID=2511982 RepID=UPI00100EF460|nr:hypothetical protein [Enterobacter cloacae complex sp. GF14B]RYA54419.1 hypothetical protein DD606_11790 [Enterobacter cloacae complex sp. GF14B]
MSDLEKFLPTLKRLSKLDKLSENEILNQFRRNHSVEPVISKSEFCHASFTVKIDDLNFLLTERPISYLNRHCGRCSNIQLHANSLGIALPLYIGEGTLSSAIHEIKRCENPLENSNKWLFENFSLEIAIAYFNKYFIKSESLKNYKTIIFEAIEAFYLGYDHISIMSLFPVFEGGLRNLLVKFCDGDNTNTSADRFEKEIRKLIITWGSRQLSNFDWHPGKGYDIETEVDFFTHLNPQCDVINSTRSFFKNVIYKPTGGVNEGSFNRHLTLHLLNQNFNEPSNFVRIFLALTHLTFAESLMNNNVPFFWEGVDDNDRRIASFISRSGDVIFGMRRKEISKLGLNLY